ncbi:hypothetical protein [Desulfofundulus sp.]|uniref:hypothetical protein n=1 Tax=Desulfofundulus sp. TaxID=2282750 RepID=UPI003C7083E0
MFKRPSPCFWVVTCKKEITGRCRAAVQNVGRPVEIQGEYPQHVICRINTLDDNWLNDARVIAAAPDLYLACGEMVRALEAWRRGEENAGLLLERAESLMKGALLYAREGKQPRWREHVLDEERQWDEILGLGPKQKLEPCLFEECPLARRKTFSEDFMRRLARMERLAASPD